MTHGLLFDVAVILAAAFPLLFLGKRFHVPEVIAYLVTGIVIGPHALGWIRDTRQVEVIAQLGVALILFFVGLRPRPSLRRFRRSAIRATASCSSSPTTTLTRRALSWPAACPRS